LGSSILCHVPAWNKKDVFNLTWPRPVWQPLCLYLIDFDSYDENLLGYNHHTKSTDLAFDLMITLSREILDGSSNTLMRAQDGLLY